jgi:hypothetical protein
VRAGAREGVRTRADCRPPRLLLGRWRRTGAAGRWVRVRGGEYPRPSSDSDRLHARVLPRLRMGRAALCYEGTGMRSARRRLGAHRRAGTLSSLRPVGSRRHFLECALLRPFRRPLPLVPGGELRHFAWVDGILRSAPRIWVAKGKHANYPSPRECDTGHWYYDSCDGNSVAYRFPVVSSAQNVGSRRQPLPLGDASNPVGCLTAERLPLPSTAADAGTRECFWDPTAAFRGWQRDPAGSAASPYARVLRYATPF